MKTAQNPPARGNLASIARLRLASAQAEIIVRREGEGTTSKQGLLCFEGISGENAGARRICMHRVVIPPSCIARPHWHAGHETTIYVLKGRVKTRYGDDLSKHVVNCAGDFIYIPAYLLHQAVNLSDSEPVEAIVARTDPNEQESVVIYDIRVDAAES
jgi:uncharacterized RmlC-like cupin family protein